MTKTLYVKDYQTENYRKMLKTLMSLLKVEVDDWSKFETDKDEEIVLTVHNQEVVAILDHMNTCDYIMCR